MEIVISFLQSIWCVCVCMCVWVDTVMDNRCTIEEEEKKKGTVYCVCVCVIVFIYCWHKTTCRIFWFFVVYRGQAVSIELEFVAALRWCLVGHYYQAGCFLGTVDGRLETGM